MQNKKNINSQINAIMLNSLSAFCTDTRGDFVEATASMIKPFIYFNEASDMEQQFLANKEEINWEQILQLLLIRLQKYIDSGGAGQKAHNSFEENPIQPKAPEPPNDEICISVIRNFIKFVAKNYNATIFIPKTNMENKNVNSKVDSPKVLTLTLYTNEKTKMIA